MLRRKLVLEPISPTSSEEEARTFLKGFIELLSATRAPLFGLRSEMRFLSATGKEFDFDAVFNHVESIRALTDTWYELLVTIHEEVKHGWQYHHLCTLNAIVESVESAEQECGEFVRGWHRCEAGFDYASLGDAVAHSTLGTVVQLVELRELVRWVETRRGEPK